MPVRNGLLSLVFHALFIGFILAPLVVVCLIAFTSEAHISYPWNGLSLRWFRAILEHPEFVDAFFFSVVLGLVSATVAIAVSIPVALAISRHTFAGRQVLMTFLLSPLLIPQVVLGVSFLRFFTGVGLSGTAVALLIAHVIVVVPFALRLVLSSTAGYDRSLESAALSLGASQWTVFRRIVLPLILPGVVSGWTIAFITSFDELTMSIFLAGPYTTTLPVRMYFHVEDVIDPLIAAISAIIIYMTLIAIFILDRTIGLETLFVGASKRER
ncbi:MAG: ABC transporter permease [Acuticoccus sp.]